MNKKIAWLIYFLIIFSLFFTSYSYSYFSDTEVSFNNRMGVSDTFCPPYQPIYPEPYNGSICKTINPILSVYVSDPNKDNMDVYFYNSNSNNLIGMVSNVKSNSRVSVVWPDLNYGVSYEWYAVAIDHEGSTSSEIWRFTVDKAPDMISLLSPEDGSTIVGLSTMLEVFVSNPDEILLNILFIDASNNQIIGSYSNIDNEIKLSIIWNELSYNTIYSWYVIADDGNFETLSNVWSFKTLTYPSSGGGGSSPSSNIPPIADVGGIYSGYVSEPILFDGSGSYDTDGSIISYDWDLGDGTKSTNDTIEHNYSKVGTYNVVLTVTDNDGAVASSSTIVPIYSPLEINDILVTPNIQNPGQNINISCSLFNNSSLANLMIHLTYPDGNISPPISIKQNNIQNTSFYYLNQSYDLMGTYQFFIEVTDINNYAVISETYQFSIEDLLCPEISNIIITPLSHAINSTININAIVTDNIGVKEVIIKIINPDNTIINYEMLRINQTNNYYSNINCVQSGIYTFNIQAIDVYDNVGWSNLEEFIIN
jgi:hypothetical protein